jgi:hypothetical protein
MAWRHEIFKDSPCKDCDKRHPACHDTCEGYQALKRRSEEYNKKIAEAKQIELLNYKSRSIGVSLRRKMKGEIR